MHPPAGGFQVHMLLTRTQQLPEDSLPSSSSACCWAAAPIATCLPPYARAALNHLSGLTLQQPSAVLGPSIFCSHACGNTL